uniref:Uncharacterized protein n=1 Tax=Amphimedon queenslandica TaxID=400682 RepID=A0A1X7UL36_AMPQE
PIIPSQYVLVVLVARNLCDLSWAMTTSVNQGILIVALHTSSTHLIHSGMVKVAAILSHLVVMFL